MTSPKSAVAAGPRPRQAATALYVSGFCGARAHERCRGAYAGVDCTCGCHQQPEPQPQPQPEPEPSAGPRIGSLFSGYGGLDLAVTAVLGGTVAWQCEYEPPSKANPRPTQAAARVLAHRFPGVPNLGDITTVDWSAVEHVDVLCGGFPCQDVSAAGLREGLKPDTRSGLWARFAHAIDQLRPSLVVIENVRGLLSADAHHPAHGDLEPCPWCLGDDEPVLLRALGAVLGDLAGLGFDAEWVGLRAADVGAPHGRFRVFVLAWPAGADTTALGRRPARRDDGLRAARLVAGSAADAEDDRREDPLGWRPKPQGARVASDRRAAAPHPDRAARGERRLAAPGQAEGGRPRADTGRRGGAPAAHPEGVGRHEGRPEPARLVGGSDAALGGDDAASDAHGDAVRQQPIPVAGCGGQTEPGHPRADAPADAESSGRGRQPRPDVEHDGPQPAHAGTSRGAPLDWGPYEPAVRRWERRLGRPAPPPTEPGSKGQPRLSPVFVEFLMGLALGWVTGVPGLTRNEMLKALGNGVVPQQAAEALRILLARLVTTTAGTVRDGCGVTAREASATTRLVAELPFAP